MAGSAWCGCVRDLALRENGKTVKPKDVATMLKLVDGTGKTGTCREYTAVERFVGSHNIVPGETEPRACTWAGCTFGHNRATVMAEYEAELAHENTLLADKTKAGKSRFSRWRMKRAATHGNIQPGLYGAPFIFHDMNDQILDPLHCAELGIPKTPWKHGLLRNGAAAAAVQGHS